MQWRHGEEKDRRRHAADAGKTDGSADVRQIDHDTPGQQGNDRTAWSRVAENNRSHQTLTHREDLRCDMSKIVGRGVARTVGIPKEQSKQETWVIAE